MQLLPERLRYAQKAEAEPGITQILAQSIETQNMVGGWVPAG